MSHVSLWPIADRFPKKKKKKKRSTSALNPSLSVKLLVIGLYTKFGFIMLLSLKIIAILVLTNQIAAK